MILRPEITQKRYDRPHARRILDTVGGGGCVAELEWCVHLLQARRLIHD
jgi:hypothetical protein